MPNTENNRSKVIDLYNEMVDYNWDDGHKRLREILNDPNCELGIASMIYWGAQPLFYKQYKSRDEAESYERDAYDLVAEIEANVAAGKYPVRYISFDPNEDQVIDKKDPGLKKIPDVLRNPVVETEA